MKYQGLFDKGFDASELNGAVFYFNQNQQLTRPCDMNPSKIKIQAQNLDHLENLMSAHRVSTEDAQRLRQVFGKNRLNAAEIKVKCIERFPYMQSLFDLWTSTPLQNITLTSVGIGLAHANIKRLTGEFADLSVWVN